MKMSIQNLVQEIKAVVLERAELEFRYMFERKSFFPLLNHLDSNSENRDHFLKCLKTNKLVQVSSYRDWHLDEKNEIGGAEEVKVW